MARTSLGPCKFIVDLGSPSHWAGFNRAPDQEAMIIKECLFDLIMNGMLSVDGSVEYTQHYTCS